MFKNFLTALHWLQLRLLYPFALFWFGFNWQFLRDIRQNKAVASMGFWLVFVPIAAKAMHQVSDVIPIELGGQIFILHTTLPFSWQSLFFAALSFSTGNLLVSILCPRIVLEHKDFGSFQSSGKIATHLHEYDERFDALNEQEREHLLHLAGIKIQTPSEVDLCNKFWKAYALQNVSSHPLRWICSAFYAIGFALLADILYKQVVWVISSFSLNSYLHQLVFWPALEWLAKLY